MTIQHKDILKSRTHKHEANVVNFDRITVLFENDKYLVVDKPTGIPVHPTGRFYFNSITESLKLQQSIPELFPCYRLDRLTSGVLILAKTAAATAEFHKVSKEGNTTKQYLARVKGNFPESVTECNEPVSHVVPKKGFAFGKGIKREAKTIFEKIKYNSDLDESIVMCKPITGRTHQIRIHLNYLQHPITNDPLYGPNASAIRNKVTNSKEVTEEDFKKLQEEFDRDYKSLTTDHFCEECGYQVYIDEDPATLTLYLHAQKYYALDGSWSHSAPDPDWCNI